MKMKKLDKELEKSEDETTKCKEIPSKSCNVCQKKFEKFCDLETHIESEHKEAETFKSKKCEKQAGAELGQAQPKLGCEENDLSLRGYIWG